MDIQVTGFLALIAGVAIIIRGPVFGIYCVVPCTLLASSAALIVPGLGSATIQPAHLLLGFLMLTIAASPGSRSRMLQCVTFPREGFWLIVTASYGVIGAYLFPRLFAGATYVNAIGATEFGFSFIQVPLGPSSGNVTQSIYFVGDVVCFLLCYAFARTPVGFAATLDAVLVYCGLNIVFACLDLATYWTGTGYLLDVIRNSTYTMHNETVVNGLKRIVGSFTEASSFAYATIGAFGFTLRLWLGGVRPRLTFSLALASATLLVFSTSTTAYAGLPLLIGYLFITSAWRARSGRAPRSVFVFLALGPLLIAVLIAVILLNPTTAETVRSFLNILLFDKSSSDSAIDRGRWNQAAVEAFLATYGFGAGIGSVRASSFALAVLANLGGVGIVAYGAFLLLTLFRRAPRPLDWFIVEVRAAARTACVALLIAATISGALIDLGLPFFILAGLACAANDLAFKQRVAPVGERIGEGQKFAGSSRGRPRDFTQPAT